MLRFSLSKMTTCEASIPTEVAMAAALADCLGAVRQGDTALQACLEKYSHAYWGELLALVRLSMRVLPREKDAPLSAQWRRRTKAFLLSVAERRGDLVSGKTR